MAWSWSAGIFENASLVGAKTVYGPAPLRVSTSPAFFTAVTRVLKSALADATAAIVFGAASVVFVVCSGLLVELVALSSLLLHAAARSPTMPATATTRSVRGVRIGLSSRSGEA